MKWYLMVLKNYVGFKGRSRRKEYWMFILFHMILSMILGAIGAIIRMPFISTIYAVVIIIPSIAVAVRRMHDINRSGWFILIPIYNLVLACTAGDSGENQYGPDPKNEDSYNGDALDADLVK